MASPDYNKSGADYPRHHKGDDCREDFPPHPQSPLQRLLRKMTVPTILLSVGLLALQAVASSGATNPKKTTTTKPNIIFILTDDQDKLMDSTKYQPLLQKYIADKGTTFDKHYCTVSLCCPSRVSLLTGKAAHNTNVTDVQGPYGGYPKFVAEGHNRNYLPIWLQNAGYDTYYTGKLMNQHGIRTYNKPYAAGWSRSDFLIDPGTYKYLDSLMTLDYQPYRSMKGSYSTDNVRKRALEFLDNGIQGNKPFFLGIAPIGPHGEASPDGFADPIPAERHKNLFNDVKIPRKPNFNPDKNGDVHYLKTIPQLDDDQVDYLDSYYRNRLRALQSVDELVEAVVKKIEANATLLANTYIFYTADNGYHLGHHRLPPGKSCNIEEDINVPMYVRGPGIAKGATVNFPTSHTDLAPTFFQIAGIPLHDDFDGLPIPLTRAQQDAQTVKSEHVNIEYWGHAYIEGTIFADYRSPTQQNTYKTLRIVAEDYDFMYAVWCTNEHTLYDMKADPHQLNNLYGTNGDAGGFPIPELTDRLDTLLLTLKNCKGATCRKPWSFVFPRSSKQQVNSLSDAMNADYDDFFYNQPRVSFSECAAGYLLEYEGPYSPEQFTMNSKGRVIHRARWEDYV